MNNTLWQASPQIIESSNLINFMSWLGKHRSLVFKDYEDLRQYSIDNTGEFWGSILEYFEVSYSGEFIDVLHGEMPNVKWFEGIKLNYAEHIFKDKALKDVALISILENGQEESFTWEELNQSVASLANWMKRQGVKEGDRVAGYLPNLAATSIAFLATVSIGGVWTCCSPDFGVESILDRFQQVKPKLLFAVSGYSYNGKYYDKIKELKTIISNIPSLENVVQVPFLGGEMLEGIINFDEVSKGGKTSLEFVRVPFSHPIWILYSSGTTGKPKSITHSHGGTLLEHYKYLSLQNDVKKGETFFWYSTTGWMMWNFLHAAWLVGARIVLYEGAAAFPSLKSLWQLASKHKINHFGTSAPYLIACMKAELNTSQLNIDLSGLRSIGSTGSPLPSEAFEYVYSSIKEDVWLCSMSGGSDVCTAFVGSNIMKPIKAGYIQCRALGVDMVAMGEDDKELIGELGEMVIRKPMPSMPIGFWGDEDGQRYYNSYFADKVGYWTHGDWIKIETDGQLMITGRSDATLNRHGVRIGTSEIYAILTDLPFIEDALIINVEFANGEHFMPLFVKVKPDEVLTEERIKLIKSKLREKGSPRHVPDRVIDALGIPYTISGKKMESPIKKLFLGMDVSKAMSKEAMRNPEVVAFYEGFAKEYLISR